MSIENFLGTMQEMAGTSSKPLAMEKVRTRIAPSPTGYPHIGTIYQALFDFSFAKKYTGSFIIRIEDTDRARFVPDAEQKLYEALDWFGLQENESPRKGGSVGPYRQSERLPLYKKYALLLIEKGHAYYCFCSKERLEEVRKKQQEEKQPIIMYDKHCRTIPQEEAMQRSQQESNWVIRLKVPENTTIVGTDGIRGDISFASNTIDDQVLLKSDGYPTYHLAVVVDDHLMEITHIVRGEEWIPSTPKHMLLYDFFGWEKPLLFHTPTLRNPDKSKLSKRHGHTNVTWYQEQGFLPEAILNYLALMGWSHPQEKEIFTLNEFVQLFELKDLSPAGPIFDLTKLTWMNGEYIRAMESQKLMQLLVDYYKTYKGISLTEKLSSDVLQQIVMLAQTRINTLADFSLLSEHFYIDVSIARTEQEEQIAKDLKQALLSVSVWEKDAIFAALKDVMQAQKIRMPLLYKIFTGQERGLPLPESLAIVGKEKTLSRLV